MTPEPEARIGSIIAGRYRLTNILGQGGMSIVYAATHVLTERPVALKLLKKNYASDRATVERFLREGRAAVRIRHPHVVDVLDMGETEDGDIYLALEQLSGATLQDRLHEAKALSPAETLTILLPIMSAVAEAHRHAFVHRDIKPANIFLSRDPGGRIVPKLLDFGIVKELNAPKENATSVGLILGTPHYMSPEQVSGAQNLSPAADIWSMGVVLYQCLSGQLPFVGANNLATMHLIVAGEFAPLDSVQPDIPEELVRAVHRALKLEPSERFADMGAMLSALESLKMRLVRTHSNPAEPIDTAEVSAPKLKPIPRSTSSASIPAPAVFPSRTPAIVLSTILVAAIGFFAFAKRNDLFPEKREEFVALHPDAALPPPKPELAAKTNAEADLKRLDRARQHLADTYEVTRDRASRLKQSLSTPDADRNTIDVMIKSSEDYAGVLERALKTCDGELNGESGHEIEKAFERGETAYEGNDLSSAESSYTKAARLIEASSKFCQVPPPPPIELPKAAAKPVAPAPTAPTAPIPTSAPAPEKPIVFRDPTEAGRKHQSRNRDRALAESHFEKAQKLAAKKNHDAAIAELDKAIALVPEFMAAYNQRALSKKSRGKLNEALVDFSKAIELEPRDAKLHFNRGLTYFAMRKWKEAGDDLGQAIRLDGSQALFYYNRALVSLKQGRPEPAQSDLSKAIELDPSSADAYFQRGLLREQAKDYSRALADFGEVTRYAPKRAEAHYRRGLILEKQGHDAESIAAFSSTIENDPGHAGAYVRRGFAYMKQKRHFDAARDLRRHLELEPASEHKEMIQRQLEKLGM